MSEIRYGIKHNDITKFFLGGILQFIYIFKCIIYLNLLTYYTYYII